MDNLENTPVAENNASDLQAQINGLRQTMHSALILIFIVAGALSIFFWRQYRSIQAELVPLKPKAAQITAEVNQINGIGNEFVRRLVDFGQKYPDFQPVLIKYNITNAPAAAAPAAVQKAPAPVKK